MYALGVQPAFQGFVVGVEAQDPGNEAASEGDGTVEEFAKDRLEFVEKHNCDRFDGTC